MPVYKFKCKSCQWLFDYLLSLNERDSDIKCPKCRNDSVRIRLGASNSVYETANKYRGKQIRSNIKKILRDRSKNHTKSIAGELIEKHDHRTVTKTGLFNEKGLIKTVWDEK